MNNPKNNKLTFVIKKNKKTAITITFNSHNDIQQRTNINIIKNNPNNNKEQNISNENDKKAQLL